MHCSFVLDWATSECLEPDAYPQSPIEDSCLLGPRSWQILRHDLPKIYFFGHPDPETNIVHEILLMETGGRGALKAGTLGGPLGDTDY